MQLIHATFLLAGLTSLASGAAFGPPGFPKFPVPPYPTTTKATTTTAKSGSTTTTTAKYGYTTTTTTSTTTTTTVRPTPSVCLTNSTASNLINGYASLLTAYNNDTANALLASDFTDTSDSINYLAGIPLGDTTFASKAAFESSQSQQPAIGFTVLSIDAITCKVAAFRWTATLGAYPVKGINILYASNLNGTDAGWQIETMFAEFNVGAWELDIGNTCGNGATVARK